MNHSVPLSRVALFNVEVKEMNDDIEYENPEINDHRLIGVYTEERYYEELDLIDEEEYLMQTCGWGN